jgi:uncharacterized protein YgbK (DUF1537 family)
MEGVLRLSPAWVFKKVDSVLRGNVLAEIEAVLRVAGLQAAVLAPANPSRGRTIREGRYFVEGVPLDQTHFANDPDHPRMASEIQTLLGPAKHPEHEIRVPDVESDWQLRKLADEHDPEQTLAAGAADFFTALLRRAIPPEGRAFNASGGMTMPAPVALVCGSRAAWTVRGRQCEEAGVRVVALTNQLELPSGEFRNLLIGIEDTEADDRETVLAALTRVASWLGDRAQPTTLLAEGGATAAAIAEQMGWQQFDVVAEAPAGVGVLRPRGKYAPLFLIKPGSYEWPEEIWRGFLSAR